MIPKKNAKVLRFLCEEFSRRNLNWALTGSTSFALQGLDYEPNDIDIQTDKESALKINSILSVYVEEPVEFSESNGIKSYFGKFNVKGLEVEVMGDLQKKHEGEWTESPDIEEEKEIIEYQEIEIPVMSLEYEAEGYKKIGRKEKAENIKRHISQD